MEKQITLTVKIRPTFWVFGFEYEDDGLSDAPKIWFFKTAHDASVFLWGRQLPHYAIFKNKTLVCLKSSELKEIEAELNNFDTSKVL